MLTVEEIKEAIDEFKLDGFVLLNDGDDIFPEWNLYFIGEYCSIDKLTILWYDHLLDKIMQGINRIDRIWITMFENVIVVFDITSVLSRKLFQTRYSGTTEGIRDAREKAIRFVLKEGV